MRINKTFLIIAAIIPAAACLASAQTLTSPNYLLLRPRIVSSGGEANSASYSMSCVEIGNVFGGGGASPNYTLRARSAAEDIVVVPAPPVVNYVKTPTNITPVTLSGTKEPGTAIFINGYEAVPVDNEISWSYDKPLEEGENYLIITCRNKDGRESESICVRIILDTIPPVIVIDKPLELSFAYESPITVEGTIDGVLFTETKELTFGLNALDTQRSDEAGNSSSKQIELYRVREPLRPPQ